MDNTLLNDVLNSMPPYAQEEFMNNLDNPEIVNNWWREKFGRMLGLDLRGELYVSYGDWKKLFEFYRDNGPLNVLRVARDPQAPMLEILITLQLLFNSDGSPIAPDTNKSFLRHCALGNTKIVKVILKNQYIKDELALFAGIEHAASNGRLSVVEAFFDLFPTINQEIDGYGALVSAIQNNKLQVAEYLAGRPLGRQLMHVFKAAVELKDSSILEKLLTVTKNFVNDEEGYLLLYAVKTNNVSAVEALLEAGANPNVRDGRLMYIASLNGYTDIVSLLIANGINTQLPLVTLAISRSIITGTGKTKQFLTKKLTTVASDETLPDEAAPSPPRKIRATTKRPSPPPKKAVIPEDDDDENGDQRSTDAGEEDTEEDS